MSKLVNFIKPIAGLLALLVFAIFFRDLFLYFVISVILSMLGRPLCERVKKIHIKNRYISSNIAALLTLVAMICIIVLFFLILIPLFNKQAAIFSNIDTKAITAYYQKPLSDLYSFLGRFNLLKSYDEVVKYIEAEINGLVNWTNFSNVFSSVISTTGDIFVGLFSVLFLTFFFLSDPNIIHNIFIAVTPEKHEEKMRIIMKDSRELLTRYMFGLIIELVSMMILLSVGLTIFGVKNAIVIGFIGGLLNVIPYLGPLMGGAIGVILGIISVLSAGTYDILTHDIIVIIATFLGANLIDNFVLQPMIYSKSVKAHPVEIFLVILMAGKIAGIPGMIIAIPAYTLIRIIAKQFLNEFKFVEMLTKKID